jgi:hypothetical protein
MIKLLVVCSLSLLATPAFAIATGDFECVSTVDGEDTYHGTMRIEDETGWAWLDPETATPGPVHKMTVVSDENIVLDAGFTAQVAPGATFFGMSYDDDTFTYEAGVLMPDIWLLVVTCTYVY